MLLPIILLVDIMTYCWWVMCPYPKYLPVPIVRADTGQVKEMCYYYLLVYS